MMIKTINLSATNTQIIPIIHSVQYDTDRQLNCVFDDVDIADVTSARIYAKKPDGTEVYNDCTIADGKITAPLTSQTLAVAGTLNCQIQLTINGTLTSFAFIVIVDESLVSSSAIESSNEYTALENVLNEVESVIDGLPSKVSKSGDSMSGDLDMTNNKVKGLATPSADTDAATKKYVDDSVSGKESTSNKVTSISSASTDTEYPSAKCVYDLIGDINTILADLVTP